MPASIKFKDMSGLRKVKRKSVLKKKISHRDLDARIELLSYCASCPLGQRQKKCFCKHLHEETDASKRWHSIKNMETAAVELRLIGHQICLGDRTDFKGL